MLTSDVTGVTPEEERSDRTIESRISTDTMSVIGGMAWEAWLSRLFGLTATLNRILTPVKTESTSHPNRVLSCRREFRRMSREPETNNESMQTGHAQVRTGSILDNSAAYRRFENERMNEQRRTIMVRIPVRFGIHRSICFMIPHELGTHAGDREDGTACHTRIDTVLPTGRQS